jgi:tRNA-specific 2-thiouridylase
VDGAVIGEHAGLMFHTIGQRQGLGIGGQRDGNGEPWYVVGKDTDTNALIVAQGGDHPALFHQRLRAASLHWIDGEPPTAPFSCQAKIRYRQPDQACVLEVRNGGTEVRFAAPQRAITPGQSIVFYLDTVCLGGGIIIAAYD